MFVEKMVRVEVDVEEFIDEYGSDPYGDGRDIYEAIDEYVEQELAEIELGPLNISVEVSS